MSELIEKRTLRIWASLDLCSRQPLMDVGMKTVLAPELTIELDRARPFSA